MSHIEEFSERLRELMEITGETAMRLAEKIGIADSRIYAYLNGKCVPDLKNAILIADYFLCSLDYLFGFCDDYEKKQRITVATVYERLKAAVDGSGKSRYRIAKDANIDDQQLHFWYYGKRPPTLISLIKLVDPLNTSLEFLAGRE